MNWLRSSKVSAILLTIIRIYVGWSFLSAGWKKLTGAKAFDAAGFLKGALGKAGGDNPSVQGWYADFVHGFALPHVGVFNFLVPWGEFLVGIGLILGTMTTFAALMGLLMNFNYLMSGTVSTNPNLVLLGFLVLMAGFNAGRFGGDFWVAPMFRRLFNKVLKKEGGNVSVVSPA